MKTKKLSITDATLREIQKKPNEILTFNEKLQFIKLMDKLKPDCIECGFIKNKTDEIFIKTICETTYNSQISIEVDLLNQDTQMIKQCLEKSKNAKVKLGIPMMIQKMEYKYKKKPKQILELLDQKIDDLKNVFNRIELSFENAELADEIFREEVLNIVRKHNINDITIQDSTGLCVYDNFKNIIAPYLNFAKENKECNICIECSENYNIAIANYAYMFKEGINNFKTTYYGSELPKTNEVCKLFFEMLKDKDTQYSLQFEANSIDAKTYEINKLLGELNFDNTNNSTSNLTISQKEDMIKNTRSGNGTKQLNEFNVEENEIAVNEVYKLKSFVVNNSNVFIPMARVELKYENKILEGFSSGNGPIDAAFKAIENIIGHHFELDDFSIHSINEGRQANGSCLVCLRYEGELYEGVGVDTDIVYASVKAFIMAINKIYSQFDL